MRTIRASEFGSYLYCKRAWWYRKQGIENQNQAELQTGEIFHQQHGAKTWRAGLLRLAGWGLLMLALILLAVALTMRWTG